MKNVTQCEMMGRPAGGLLNLEIRYARKLKFLAEIFVIYSVVSAVVLVAFVQYGQYSLLFWIVYAVNAVSVVLLTDAAFRRLKVVAGDVFGGDVDESTE